MILYILTHLAPVIWENLCKVQQTQCLTHKISMTNFCIVNVAEAVILKRTVNYFRIKIAVHSHCTVPKSAKFPILSILLMRQAKYLVLTSPFNLRHQRRELHHGITDSRRFGKCCPGFADKCILNRLSACLKKPLFTQMILSVGLIREQKSRRRADLVRLRLFSKSMPFSSQIKLKPITAQ